MTYFQLRALMYTERIDPIVVLAGRMALSGITFGVVYNPPDTSVQISI